MVSNDEINEQMDQLAEAREAITECGNAAALMGAQLMGDELANKARELARVEVAIGAMHDIEREVPFI